MSRRLLLSWMMGCMIWLLISSCQTAPEPTHRVWLSSVDDTTSMLHVIHLTDQRADSMRLPWPIFRLDTGDVTGNGIPEIAVGVTKSSRYWPTPARRLFIYQLIDGYRIRPLWLGSRVGWPLQDFHVRHDSLPARIITTEQKADSTLLYGQYRYKGFGLTFEKYLNEQ